MPCRTLFLAISAMTLIGCSRSSTLAGWVELDDLIVTGVFDPASPGELAYVFASHEDTPVRLTSSVAAPKLRKGITCCYTATDGLWIDGKKAAFPGGQEVFAILPEGKVEPIDVTASEMKNLVEVLRSSDEPIRPGVTYSLREKFLAPFSSQATESTES